MEWFLLRRPGTFLAHRSLSEAGEDLVGSLVAVTTSCV